MRSLAQQTASSTSSGASVTRRILENAGALFGATVMTRGLRVAVLIILARHLGLREFGTLAFVLAYTEIFRVFADFGVDTALMRRVATGWEQNRWISAAAALKGVFAIIAYALGIGMAWIFGYPPETIRLLAIGLVGVFLSAGSNLLAVPFQASLQSFKIIWTGVVGTGIYVLLAGVGALTGRNIVYFLGAGLTAELMSLILTWAVATRRVKLSSARWDEGMRLLRDALPIGAITLVVIAYGRVGLLLLERMRGTPEVGTYVIALRIVEVLLYFAGAIAGSAYPEMARLLGRHESLALDRLYGALYRRAVAGVTAIALALMVAGPVMRYAGFEAASAAPIVALLAWTAVFVIANQLSASLLLAAGRGSWVLIIAGWNFVLNAALNMLLVPQYGEVGVAAALLVTEGVNTLIQSLVVWKRFEITPRVGLWVRAVGACAAGAYVASTSYFVLPLVAVLYVFLSAWLKDFPGLSLPGLLGFAHSSRPEKLA